MSELSFSLSAEVGAGIALSAAEGDEQATRMKLVCYEQPTGTRGRGVVVFKRGSLLILTCVTNIAGSGKC